MPQYVPTPCTQYKCSKHTFAKRQKERKKGNRWGGGLKRFFFLLGGTNSYIAVQYNEFNLCWQHRLKLGSFFLFLLRFILLAIYRAKLNGFYCAAHGIGYLL